MCKQSQFKPSHTLVEERRYAKKIMWINEQQSTRTSVTPPDTKLPDRSHFLEENTFPKVYPPSTDPAMRKQKTTPTDATTKLMK